MSSQFEASDDTKTLQNYLGQRKINSCEYIAQKDDIFKKKVVWCCLENRPIIRGLMLKADKLLERNEK
jgi:hypothetical protein